MPALRATAVAVRDRSPVALGELVAMLSAMPPTPIGLRLVMIAATAAANEQVAAARCRCWETAVEGLHGGRPVPRGAEPVPAPDGHTGPYL